MQRRVAVGFVILVVAAAVWFSAAELLWPARAMLVVITAVLPAVAAIQVRVLTQLDPLPRITLYINSILSLWILTAITMIAARAAGFTPALMGLRMPAPATMALWTVIPLGIAGAVYTVVRALGLRESRVLTELLPRTGTEKAIFVAVSLTAGICEELIFRGFLVAAFAAATGSLAIGVVIGAVVFGAMHFYQSAAGLLRATVLGAALTLPLLFAGSIFPAILAHVLIDLIGGLVVPRRSADRGAPLAHPGGNEETRGPPCVV